MSFISLSSRHTNGCIYNEILKKQYHSLRCFDLIHDKPTVSRVRHALVQLQTSFAMHLWWKRSLTQVFDGTFSTSYCMVFSYFFYVMLRSICKSFPVQIVGSSFTIPIESCYFSVIIFNIALNYRVNMKRYILLVSFLRSVCELIFYFFRIKLCLFAIVMLLQIDVVYIHITVPYN